MSIFKQLSQSRKLRNRLIALLVVLIVAALSGIPIENGLGYAFLMASLSLIALGVRPKIKPMPRFVMAFSGLFFCCLVVGAFQWSYLAAATEKRVEARAQMLEKVVEDTKLEIDQFFPNGLPSHCLYQGPTYNRRTYNSKRKWVEQRLDELVGPSPKEPATFEKLYSSYTAVSDKEARKLVNCRLDPSCQLRAEELAKLESRKARLEAERKNKARLARRENLRLQVQKEYGLEEQRLWSARRLWEEKYIELCFPFEPSDLSRLQRATTKMEAVHSSYG